MQDNQSIKIPRETVLEATESLPSEQRDSILALYDYAAEKRLSLADLAAGMGRDRTTIHKVFSGTHGAGKTEFCDAARRFLKIAREREGSESVGFVETRLARSIWGAADRARRYNKITFVLGESQIGKTTALRAYAERNKANTVFVRMPSSPTLRLFIFRLSRLLGAPERMTHPARREYILSKLGENDLLIVDEAHQAFLTENNLNPTHARIFEYIREVHDCTRAGITLVATNVFSERLAGSESLRKVFDQTTRRGLYTFRCPDLPLAEDLARIASAMGLPPITPEARRLQDETIRRDKLGVWITLLRMGAAVAHNKQTAFDWSCVIAAADSRDKLQGR